MEKFDIRKLKEALDNQNPDEIKNAGKKLEDIFNESKKYNANPETGTVGYKNDSEDSLNKNYGIDFGGHRSRKSKKEQKTVVDDQEKLNNTKLYIQIVNTISQIETLDMDIKYLQEAKNNAINDFEMKIKHLENQKNQMDDELKSRFNKEDIINIVDNVSTDKIEINDEKRKQIKSFFA